MYVMSSLVRVCLVDVIRVIYKMPVWPVHSDAYLM